MTSKTGERKRRLEEALYETPFLEKRGDVKETRRQECGTMGVDKNGLDVCHLGKRREGGEDLEYWVKRLGTTGVDLAEHQLLELVVQRQDTSTGNTTENVGTGTLEEGLDTFSLDDLRTGVHHVLVVDLGTRGHHHTTTDGVERVGSETGTGGDSPTETEGGEEVALKRTNEDNGLDRVVHSEVETTVDDDTNDGRDETTVETGDTIRSEGLPVDVDQTVELTGSTTLGGTLGVVGETGTGVVEGVDEEKGRSTGGTTRGDVTSEPLGVTLRLLETEQGLEVVLEGKVQSLGGEVTEHVGGVTTPEGSETLVPVGPAEAVTDTLVRVGETTLLDHLVLVLDEELDSLNGGSSGLGDSGRDTTHHEVDGEGPQVLWLLVGNLGHFGDLDRNLSFFWCLGVRYYVLLERRRRDDEIYKEEKKEGKEW